MSSKASSSPAATLPLSRRSIDLAISFWFIVFAFSTTFTDLHNFTASVKGVEVKDLEHAQLVYPPPFLTALYFKWARTVDPLLYSNPVWWQCIEWVNLIVLTPFAFVAAVGFLRGWSSIRIPAIVVSAFTNYSLNICMGATLFGPEPSADPSIFTGIYFIYWTFPLLVIARLYQDQPFARWGSLKNKVFNLLAFIQFAIFFAYVAKWIVKYDAGLLPAAWLPSLQLVFLSLP